MELTREQILANRSLWCASLRLTGDRAFSQTTGQLAREQYRSAERSYCCLGVVCETIGPDYGLIRSAYDSEFYAYTFADGEEFDEDKDGIEYRVTLDTSLEGPLLAALGLSENMQNFLIKCNDTYRFTFPEIAEVVEALPVYGFDEAAEAFDDDYLFENSDALPEHLRLKISNYRDREPGS